MKRLLLATAIVVAFAAFAGGPDSTFQKVGTLTTGAPDAGTASVAVGVGAYVKVSCPGEAYIGVGTLCRLADGGLPCDLYPAGEKFYAKTLTTSGFVSAYMPDAGVQSCGVFEARN